MSACLQQATVLLKKRQKDERKNQGANSNKTAHSSAYDDIDEQRNVSFLGTVQ